MSGRIGEVLGVVVVVSAVYAILYWLSLYLLEPYHQQWLNDTKNAVPWSPKVDPATLAFFALSPFNAYEAQHIGWSNPWAYFLASVVFIILLLASLVYLHDSLWEGAGRATGLLGWQFLASSALYAVALSYVVSAVVWLRSDAPSIGTSIYDEYILLAGIYVAMRTVYILLTSTHTTTKIEESAERRLLKAAAVLAIIFVIILLEYVLVTYIPPNTLQHKLGLLLSIAVIYAWHRRLARPRAPRRLS